MKQDIGNFRWFLP